MQKLWSILFGVTMIGIFLLTAASPLLGWWMPRNVSTYGEAVDGLFYLILAITGIVFVLTEAVLVYNLYVFAGEPGDGRKAVYIHGNHKLEIVWTAVPSFILIFLAFWQINVWADIKYPASIAKRAAHDSLQVEVSARQWEWRIRYPSPERFESWQADTGATAAEDYRTRLPEHADDVKLPNELHVWQGNNVLVHLNTQDVIHSFYLPNFRLKQDALPGKTIPVWFQANDFNTIFHPRLKRWIDGYHPVGGLDQTVTSQIWDIACAEFCGARHSLMRGKLFVHKDRADFLAWLKTAAAAQHQRTIEPTTTEEPKKLTTAAR